MQALVAHSTRLAVDRLAFQRWRPFIRYHSVLRGISTPPEATTFHDKISYILALDDKSLNEQLNQLTKSYPTPDDAAVRDLAAHLCVPAQDLCASPFALRVGALAAQEGVAIVHQELRKWPPLPNQEEKTNWSQGVLTVPLTNFHYDDMFATYNPNLPKWTTYEMLTRYCKFFWRPGITRWELYIAAKLNQIIPTLHWHGLEQIQINKEQATQQNKTDKQTTPDKDKNTKEIFTSSFALVPSSTPSNAVHLKESLWHYVREVSKVENEMEFVNCHVRSDEEEHKLSYPWRDLDSSVDATEYVASHIDRLNSEEVETVFSAFPSHYFDDMEQYMEHLEKCLETLLFRDIPIGIDAEAVGNKLYTRLCADLLLREASFMLCDKQKNPNGLQEFKKTIEFKDKGMVTAMSIFKSKLRPDTLAIGAGQFPLLNSEKSVKTEWNALIQLQEGLTASFPATVQLLRSSKLQDAQFAQIAQQFARSPHIFQRTPLEVRFSAFLQSLKTPPHSLILDMMKFESAILNAKEDLQVEQLSTPIGEFGETDWDTINETVVKASGAFKLVQTSYDVYSLHEILTNEKKPASSQQKHNQSKKSQPSKQPDPFSTAPKSSSYLIGLYAGEVAILSVSQEWVVVWEWLTKHKEERLTCGDVRKKMEGMSDEELLGHLENFSEAGAIGLFPAA